MFARPGKTLMEYARALFLALVVLFIGLGLILIASNYVFYGIITMVAGILASFISCLLLAAIGQAVESLRIIAVSTHTMAGEPLEDELPLNPVDTAV